MISRVFQNSDDQLDDTPTQPEEYISPAPRVSVQAYCASVANATAVRAASEDRRLGKAHLTVHMGGLAAAIDAYHTAPTPNVILLETEPGRDILEGLDEMLTVTRLGLPSSLRRSLACTNIIENMMGTVRRVCRNVKRWRDASMALRWTAAAMQEAVKGFRRLKAYRQLPMLRTALAAHQSNHTDHTALEPDILAA